MSYRSQRGAQHGSRQLQRPGRSGSVARRSIAELAAADRRAAQMPETRQPRPSTAAAGGRRPTGGPPSPPGTANHAAARRGTETHEVVLRGAARPRGVRLPRGRQPHGSMTRRGVAHRGLLLPRSRRPPQRSTQRPTSRLTRASFHHRRQRCDSPVQTRLVSSSSSGVIWDGLRFCF